MLIDIYAMVLHIVMRRKGLFRLHSYSVKINFVDAFIKMIEVNHGFVNVKQNVMRLFLAFILISMATCKKDQLTTDLGMNVAKWNQKGISDYEFTLRKICFCPIEYTGPFVIKVVGGNIVSVNGFDYKPETIGVLWTMDSLFDYIKSSIDKKPAKQTIQYNAEYGYPELIFFDFDERMADEEIRIEVSNFKVVN